MRRRFPTLLLFGLLGFVGVTGASASSAVLPPAWGNAIEVPGTATLNSGGDSGVNSISCPTAGNCAAGGYYSSVGQYHDHVFVVDETNGAWGTAIEVPGMATLDSGGTPDISSVSCATAGNCVAGGFYDASSGRHAFVVDETNGSWGPAIEVPGTAASGRVSSVSCATAGNCVAGGFYEDGSGAFVVDETNGSWGHAVDVSGAAVRVNSVSCTTTGNCTAGGDSANGGVFVAEKTNGSWGGAIEVPGTATLRNGGYASLSSVSCATAANCAAGGSYILPHVSHTQAWVAVKTNGSWGTAIEVPGTATGGHASVMSVSCATAGNCTAGGFYTPGSGPMQTFVADETNGSWGTAIEVPGTATLNNGNGGALVQSVSCATAGNCTAGGSYTGGSGTEVFVADETNGNWGTAIEVPGTATLNSGGYAEIDSVSCGTAGNCAAGGLYYGSGAHPFVVSSTEAVATTLVPAPVSGTYGGTATLSATLTSGGNGVPGRTVTFTLNGSSAGSATTDINGVATLNNASLSGINTGTYASGVGASSVADSVTGTSALTVSPADQAILIIQHAPATALVGGQFTVAATGGGSGNAVVYGASGSCTKSGATYTITGAGTCLVTFNQDSNSNYNAAPQLTEAVNSSKANQTIQVMTDAPASAVYGTGFTVAATGGGSGNPVTYGASGSCINTGAQFTMTSGTGTCTVTYNQAGNANYNAAPQKTKSVTATKLAQAITFATPSAHTYGDGNLDPGATASSGFAVSYQASGSCSILGGIVHFTGAGPCTVTASQAGDADHSPAPQVQRTFSVSKAALSITADDRHRFYAQPLTLGTTAYAPSGLVGSDSVSGVTLTSAGAVGSATPGDYSIVPSQAVAGPTTDLVDNYAITYNNGTLHVNPVGIIGVNGVSVKTSGGTIDSFDSSAGPYGPANHGSAALVMSNGPLGLAGVVLSGSGTSTHGAVTVASTARVSGNVRAGTTASIAGTVAGTVTRNSPSTALSRPTVAACSPYSSKTGITGGTFSYSASTGNLTVKTGTVTLANRTYCFHTIALTAGTKLAVNGPVTIHLTGKITGGSGHIVNSTNNPANLHIDTSYTGTGGVTLAGSSNAYMTILAPGTSVTIPSGSFFGTLLAGTVNLTGTGAFHADTH